MKKKICIIIIVLLYAIAYIPVSASPPEEPKKADGDGRIRVCGAQGGNVEIDIQITLTGDDGSTVVHNINMPLQDPANSNHAATWLTTILKNSYGDYYDAEVVEGTYGVEGLHYSIVDFNVKGQPDGPQYKITDIDVKVTGTPTNKGGGSAIDPIPPLGYVFLDISGNPTSGYVEVWVDDIWAVVQSNGKSIVQIKTELNEKLVVNEIPAAIDSNGELFIKPINADSGIWIGSTDSGIDVYSSLHLIIAPNTPMKPTGPSEGKQDVEYEFVTSSIDSNNDLIQYGWDWNGDLIIDEWTDFYESGELVIVKHSWDSEETYNIQVIAKDEWGFESYWSEPLEIMIPKNKPFNKPFINFLQQYQHLFPILKYLLQFN